jgi:TRAP-type C4-dicarboxylate transport system substrate-binding protein
MTDLGIVTKRRSTKDGGPAAMTRRASLFGLAACCLLPPREAAAQETWEFKVSSFLPPVHHHQAVIFAEWTKELAERSGGRLQLKHFPAQQMGPMPRQFDLARQGVADTALVLHGGTPGRFPLTELAHLPFLMPSGEIAAQVLMDLLPDYLGKEHEGVRVLYIWSHAPGSIHTRTKPVQAPADLKGMRIRHPSTTVADMLTAFGATPVGVPPNEIADALSKGTIDGLVMPYDGAFGFRLGNEVRYTTELKGYVATFAVVMNPRSYERLPPDLRQLIDETTGRDAARRVGRAWDEIEEPGKKYMVGSGDTVIPLTPEQRAEFEKASTLVAEKRIAELEGKGLPARAVYEKMKALVAQYGGKS